MSVEQRDPAVCPGCMTKSSSPAEPVLVYSDCQTGRGTRDAGCLDLGGGTNISKRALFVSIHNKSGWS